MDEGWTTAFEYLRNREVLGVPTPTRSSSRSGQRPRAAPIGLRPADHHAHDPCGPDANLRFQPVRQAGSVPGAQDLMGDAAFRKALQEFMARWNGKRPLPWTCSTASTTPASQLHVFFQNWFFGYNTSTGRGRRAQRGGGQTVTVRNPAAWRCPSTGVDYADAAASACTARPRLAGDGRKTDVQVAGGKALRSMTLDTGIFVDANPATTPGRRQGRQPLRNSSGNGFRYRPVSTSPAPRVPGRS